MVQGSDFLDCVLLVVVAVVSAGMPNIGAALVASGAATSAPP